MNFQVKLFCCMSFFITVLVSTQSFADVCWKNTYGRGVGVIPSNCDPTGLAKSGLLCYKKPEPGWYVVAGIAQPSCPKGFRDDGLFCYKPDSYGRGAGYPWQFGDGFNLDGARSRCQSQNPQGCEQDGLIIYPKCKPGFKPFGCCVCTPECPPGMSDAGISCAKPTRVEKPIPASCSAQQEYDAGLCYNKCNQGFYGIGPVCWGTCPKDMVDCGAMCGSSWIECATSVGEMVMAFGESVSKIAGIIGTLGVSTTSTLATEAGKQSLIAGLKETAKKLAKEMAKKFAGAAKDVIASKVAAELKKIPNMPSFIADQLSKMASDADNFDYQGFLVGLDPTGLSKLAMTFVKPVCPVPAPGAAAAPVEVDRFTPVETAKPTEAQKAAERLAKIPDICEYMRSEVKSEKFRRYLTQYESLFKTFNPIRKSLIDSIPEDKWWALVNMECDGIRKLPSFIKVAEIPWLKWTNSERAIAVGHISEATKDVFPADKLNNFELMGLLRGHVQLGNLKSPCDITRYPEFIKGELNIFVNPAKYRSLADGPGYPDKDVKTDAEKFLSAKTIEKSNWSRADLVNILTMDCNQMMEAPSWAAIISIPPEQWSADQRNSAIDLIQKATKDPALKLQQLSNRELLGFFIWDAIK